MDGVCCHTSITPGGEDLSFLVVVASKQVFMRRFAATVFSLFLVYAVLCPGFCVAQERAVNRHACCPQQPGDQQDQGKPPASYPCHQVVSASQAPVVALPSDAWVSESFSGAAALLRASVTLPPAPRPLKPPSPRQLSILRI